MFNRGRGPVIAATVMQILLLTRQFIYHPERQTSGVYKRLTMFIEAISSIADLDILCYTNPEIRFSQDGIAGFEKAFSSYWGNKVRIFTCPVNEYRDKTRLASRFSYLKGIYSFFNQRLYYEASGREQVRELESRLDSRPDAVFAHRLAAMSPVLLTRIPLPPVFFDLDDIEHVLLGRFIRNGGAFKKLLYLHFPALYWGERQAIRLAARTFVCSKGDCDYLTKKFKASRVVTIPNAVRIPDYRPPTMEPTILFLGAFFTQNVYAARLLIDSIWPRIIGKMPEARLIIAGMTKEQIGYGGRKLEGVEITGFVDDLDLLYERARIIATPILVGGGTRVKIIEAGAYGKPVVSTTIGAEGIDLENEREILIRDNPRDFADACLRLLGDHKLSTEIGSRSRRKIAGENNRDSVIGNIRNRILEVLRPGA